MIQAGFTKKQIMSCGYTEKEFVDAENALCTNAQEYSQSKVFSEYCNFK